MSDESVPKPSKKNRNHHLQRVLYKTIQESDEQNSEVWKFEVEDVIGQVVYIPKTIYMLLYNNSILHLLPV